MLATASVLLLQKVRSTPIEMLEVRPRLLLGSMGDAMAVFTRVASVVASHKVTHVLSLCNERPEWMNKLDSELELENSGSGEEMDDIQEEKTEDKLSVTVDVGSHSIETKDEEEGAGRKSKKRQRRRGKGCVELPKWKKFVEVLDMPKSDLLHHFESCCHFIREGREKGTILVHCEHGISRSVTVVLAYLMWSEHRPLKVLYLDLKERRPEIRPNSGFMDQLRLWEEMSCQIREDNKKYRAYRLQCKAREIESAGYVDRVDMAPDPASTPMDATVYFRCRRCRQLLFTDSDVLQHDLGEGKRSFQRHKRKKDKQGEVAQRREEEEEPIDDVTASNQTSIQDDMKIIGEKKDGEVSEQAVLGGNQELSMALPDSPLGQDDPSLPPAPLTPAELSKMREELASIVVQRGQSLTFAACSSYFIEPVTWMGQALLGHMEGKILCPKCNSRLGSFSWKGQQCSCGRWLTPAFQVHKNRVDEVRSLTRRKTQHQH